MGSFRQLLLVAFLLIAALLGGTALRAVVILDRLMAKSSEAAGHALALNGAAQALTARTAGMERAARQSLILNDAVLRKRFDEETRAARAALAEIDAGGLPKPELLLWQAQAEAIQRLFQGPPETALERERNIAAEFRELAALNNRITAGTQALIEHRNKALDEQLEASRARLTRQVLFTIALAVMLAVALGVWLARPFKHLERAIIGLGENRLGEPINIKGPLDVRRVSQHLEWLRLRLTELDADKARFLRHVSHELKTPLAALREGVALLQEGVPGELNRSQRDVIRILNQNTLTLQGQIEALLRFNAAAFEAGQLQRSRTNLTDLIEEQIDAQHLQCQAMQLNVVVEGEPVMLTVDREKLGTTIANLLSNAIRFSPRGGTIRVQVSAQPDHVRIDVLDQGPGVAATDRERVFEPFYRGERQPKDAVRGTGIGLSIVKEYIQAHGGRIGLPSDSQGGHFRIELPHAS
ncbi:sensor histidine kinase [Caenimonas soli]|uniref:sensor histidine kinase n=1 Tax=Caenimonas soli TaxID=2735555 RepID=UPI001555FC2E|nr:ATP-binding protein [Caenimonas soli]NPC58887.1 two-component sensor histidine kinase [Caenimonas soli]